MIREEDIDLSLIKAVTVICNDPYATDSSSDDEAISGNNPRRPIKPKPPKRYVSKICVPTLIKRYENVSNSKGKKATGNRRSSSEFKGVRRRPWGRFSAEIRNPFEKKRIWLGTFSTEKEAAEAYQRSKREFDKRSGLVKPEVDLAKPSGLRKPEVKEVESAKPCGVRKPEEKEVESAKTFGCGYVDEDEGMIARMLEDPLMTCSISDIFRDSVIESNCILVDHNFPEFDSNFDELKFDFLENDYTDLRFGFEIEGTDLLEFDPLIDEFKLEDFPMDAFGLLGEAEVDDYSWIDKSL